MVGGVIPLVGDGRLLSTVVFFLAVFSFSFLSGLVSGVYSLVFNMRFPFLVHFPLDMNFNRKVDLGFPLLGVMCFSL